MQATHDVIGDCDDKVNSRSVLVLNPLEDSSRFQSHLDDENETVNSKTVGE